MPASSAISKILFTQLPKSDKQFCTKVHAPPTALVIALIADTAHVGMPKPISLA